MKKRFSTMLAAVLLLTITACGGSPSGSEQGTGSSVPAPGSSLPAVSEPSGSSSEPDTSEQDGKILIAYFSWSGNTEQLAGMIQEATGGDLFTIEPVTPYTDNYNELLDVATQEQNDQARPAVAGTVENRDDYDTVFIGYPNWWSDTPMIVRTFLESYDCAGKTVIPFCTSGGGGFGRSVDSVTESAAGATILNGFEVNGSRVVSAVILSRCVFGFLHIQGVMSFARLTHMLSSHWGFMFMSLHLGLHWGMLTRRFQFSGKLPALLGGIIAAYGVYAFFKRDLLTYLLMKTHFVFMDFHESKILFYLDYLAIMGTFIFLSHYIMKLLKTGRSASQ